MYIRTLCVALTFRGVLAAGPCPAHLVHQTVSSSGQIYDADAEEVDTLDLLSLLQVSVISHLHSRGSNASNTAEAIEYTNVTHGTDVSPLAFVKPNVPGHMVVNDGKPRVEDAKADVHLPQNENHDRQQPVEPHNNCRSSKLCQPKPVLDSKDMATSTQRPDDKLPLPDIEKSETQSGPITIQSRFKQQVKQQELALFIEELAEEFVHDVMSRLKSAFHTTVTSVSCGLVPSKHCLNGVGNWDADVRLRSFVAYSEVLLVGVVAVASLSQQRKCWRLPHLQTVEVHLVMSLALLSVLARIVAQPFFGLAFSLGLRYLVEGYMILVALYILPSMLGRCMAEAQVREQRRAAEHFVLQNSFFERESIHNTPPLLDVAIVQQRLRPEIPKFPHSVPPMPSLLTFVLCVMRPLLGILCGFAKHHQPLAMSICLWSNIWLIVLGLVLTAGLVRETFSQIAQYVPTCEIVAYSIGLLPLLGGLQDATLCGSLIPGAISHAGMLYLHEVTAVTIFVIYMVWQGAHFPKKKVGSYDIVEVAGWQRWLQEVLNPHCVLKSLSSNDNPDVDNAP